MAAKKEVDVVFWKAIIGPICLVLVILFINFVVKPHNAARDRGEAKPLLFDVFGRSKPKQQQPKVFVSQPAPEESYVGSWPPPPPRYAPPLRWEEDPVVFD